MVRSTAGKARISIVWMVTVGVLFLVAVFFAYVSQSDLTTERKAVADAQTARLEAATKLEEQLRLSRSISTVLGWYDRAATDSQTDPAAAQKALEELRATYSDLGAAEKDFESALPKILAAYSARGAKIAELETRVKGLTSEVSSAQAAVTQVTSEKDSTISDLRKQVADETNNAKSREQELEGRLEQMRTQLSERDGELRKVREDAALAVREAGRVKAIDDARIAALSETTKFALDPFSSQPDGKVLEVSEKLGTGWIDRGANQRVVRGMRFQIRSSRPGDKNIKAWAEVTSVKSGTAEVVFSDLADRYSPVVAGDVIVNPVYDPVGGRNAVLLGRFTGSYSTTDLTTLLDKMGIHVQSKIDRTTHFLIVGSDLYNDPATGEPLETPMPASDLAEYKQAEALGVQILPLQDIRDYFRLGAGQ
jgi:hypothetical protein